MLQGANTNLSNPLVPKGHIYECQNILISFTNEVSKSQLKLISGVLFFAASALMG